MMSFLHFKIWTIDSVGDKLSFHSPGFLSQWNVVFSAHPLSPVKCKERRVAEVCVCVRVLYFHTLAGIKLCVTTWSVLWFFYHITSHDITLINTNPRSWNHWVSVHDFWQRKKKKKLFKVVLFLFLLTAGVAGLVFGVLEFALLRVRVCLFGVSLCKKWLKRLSSVCTRDSLKDCGWTWSCWIKKKHL